MKGNKTANNQGIRFLTHPVLVQVAGWVVGWEVGTDIDNRTSLNLTGTERVNWI